MPWRGLLEPLRPGLLERADREVDSPPRSSSFRLAHDDVRDSDLQHAQREALQGGTERGHRLLRGPTGRRRRR
jgi:hypothetical protein